MKCNRIRLRLRLSENSFDNVINCTGLIDQTLLPANSSGLFWV